MSITVELSKELKKINNTILENELIEDINSNVFTTIDNEIKEFKIYLPLVGNFNAGKSSILNTLLEEDELFPTDIVPETAIATEILFSTNERVEAYDFKKHEIIETFDNLEKLKERDIEKYGYLKVYKNIEFLSQNQDVVFVDMPGLDSNIDRHNSQILNYIQKEGISFIAVIDIDDGTVKDSTLKFIEEINSYKLDFFVLINKTDKKPPSEVKKIQENIENQLLKYTDTPFVGAVTTFDEEINDVKKIVSKLDKEKYIKALFIQKIIFNIQKLSQNLQVRKNSIQMDTSEIDKKIEEFLEGIHKFDKSLRSEKQRIENEFSTNTTTQIQNEIKIALNQNIDRLLMSIKTSEEDFKITINDIIRPVIVKAIKKYTEQEFSIALEHLEASTSDIFSDISDFLNKGSFAINAVGDIIKHTPILLKIPVLANILNFILTKFNPMVATITTIVTVISSFFGKSKEEQEREAHEQMRENMKNSVIPNIIMQLQPTIQDILNNIKEEFFKEIENSINEQKEELISSINKAKEEKKKYKNEIHTKIIEFEEIIKRLQTHEKIIYQISI